MRDKIIEDLLGLVNLTGRYVIFNLTKEEEDLITEYLQVEDYNVPELKVLRNMLVIAISHQIQEAVELDDVSKVQLLSSWLTVTTSIIDNQIFNKGGQV